MKDYMRLVFTSEITRRNGTSLERVWHPMTRDVRTLGALGGRGCHTTDEQSY